MRHSAGCKREGRVGKREGGGAGCGVVRLGFVAGGGKGGAVLVG